MSLLKTAVFLASRFDEFAELRGQLKELIANYPVVQFAPIDLNNGNVSHRPPLVECLGYVRRAEFVILLLGDSYGSLAPKSDKSFTHLEYEEAIKDGSGTRVLVFGIGENYRGGRIHYSSDERLAALQKQIEENHTLGFFDPETPVETIAKTIFDRLLAALYEMRFGVLSVDTRGDIPDDLFDAIDDGALLDDTEVSALEERNAWGPSLTDDRARFTNTLTAMTQPAAVAALEQREEAQRALDIGEYGVAIRHLKQALKLKPLELISNYWLAQLYVALGRKEKASEAMEMAERAARIAERDALPYRASAAYITAAKAAQLANHPNEALSFARQAVEVAPRYARAHVEMARQYALIREIKPALDAIRQAFTLYSKSLREVFGDPIFRPMRKEIDTLVQDLKAKIARDVDDLIRIESEIAGLAGTSAVNVATEGKTISQLMEAGRQSSRRQYDHVCVLMEKAEQAMQEMLAETPKPPPSTQELLRFNRPGRATIVEWLKQPGDVIQPDEVVASFHYEGSTKIIPWSLRARAAVRMTARTGNNGTLISSEKPYLFEHIPATILVTEPSRVQRIRKGIESTTEHLESATNRLMEVRTQREALLQARNSHQRQGMAIPGMTLLLVSAMSAAAGLLLSIGFGQWILGAILIGVALLCLKYGSRRRDAYRNRLSTLEQSLSQVDQELTRSIDHTTQHENTLTSLRSTLSAIEDSCEKAKSRALEALQKFEGISLRKGGRLLPFPSIHGAQTGDVVKVFERQLEQIKSESRREIEARSDLPEWAYAKIEGKAKTRLLRVIDVSAERLVLSHRQAYAITKESK